MSVLCNNKTEICQWQDVADQTPTQILYFNLLLQYISYIVQKLKLLPERLEILSWVNQWVMLKKLHISSLLGELGELLHFWSHLSRAQGSPRRLLQACIKRYSYHKYFHCKILLKTWCHVHRHFKALYNFRLTLTRQVFLSVPGWHLPSWRIVPVWTW